MPFGLTNALVQLQNIFSNFFNIYVIIYLKDILIFSKKLNAHPQMIQDILRRLHKHSLYAKASNCEFHQDSVEFLEMIVLAKALKCVKTKSK